MLVSTGVSAAALLALEHGVPLLTTPLGTRGLHAKETRGAVSVARTPAEFAAAAVQLHQNATRWLEQRGRARAHAARHLVPGRLQRELRRAIAEAIGR